jgi:hypothetical protein
VIHEPLARRPTSPLPLGVQVPDELMLWRQLDPPQTSHLDAAVSAITDSRSLVKRYAASITGRGGDAGLPESSVSMLEPSSSLASKRSSTRLRPVSIEVRAQRAVVPIPVDGRETGADLARACAC